MNCIVIPVYKEYKNLCVKEITSLNQLYDILGSQNICFVGPPQIEWDCYSKVAKSRDIIPLIKTFEEGYFEDIKGYNQLLISSIFYARFREFNFILIYQLDAYVFRNDLDFWCNKGYDYIGAPWFRIEINENEVLDDVGNGGLSLRNVKNSLNLLKKLRYLEVLERYNNFNWKGFLPRLPMFIFNLLNSRGNTSDFEQKFTGNEDKFWGRLAPQRIENFRYRTKLYGLISSCFLKPSFKVAPINEAIKFSFEVNPRLLYTINNNTLPFGCHAWGKYDYDFWKPFIAEAKDSL